MTKTVAILLAVTLAACGSASQAGPKTSNPPLDPAKTAKKAPDPAKRPAVEVEGLTVKFNALGFKITLPSDAWSGKALPQQDGSMQLLFLRQDLPIMMFLQPVTSEDMDLKGVAEAVHKDAEGSLPAGSVGPLTREANGRWSFTAEAAKQDGTKIKGYLAVQEIGSGKKRYLISNTLMPADAYDANIAEPVSILDSVAPLQ